MSLVLLQTTLSGSNPPPPNPPTGISPDSFSVDDGTDTTGGHSLGTMTATGGVAPLTWSKNGGADQAKFTINSSTGALTIDDGVLDRGTKSTYVVIIRVTDNNSDTFDGTVTVTVAAVASSTTLGIQTEAPKLYGTSEAVDFTLTVLNGAGTGTFSVVEGQLPGGLSLNTSTGQISGTTGASGETQRPTIKYSEGSGLLESVKYTLVFHVLEDRTGTIAGGSDLEPWETLADHTEYTLQANATFKTTGFVMKHDNVVINRSTHTVTWDNDAHPLTITNNDFATGTVDQAPPNWTVPAGWVIKTGTLAAGTVYRDGFRCIQGAIDDGETIRLTATSVSGSLAFDDSYVAWFWGDHGFNLTYRVIVGSNDSNSLDSGDLEVLERPNKNDSRLGTVGMYAFRADGNPTESITEIHIDITNNTGSNITDLRFGPLYFTRSKVYGFHNIPTQADTPYSDNVVTQNWYTTIGSGAINQGQDSAMCDTFGNISGRGAAVDGATILLKSKLYAKAGQEHGRVIAGQGCVVTNCTITSQCEAAVNRDSNAPRVVTCSQDTVGNVVSGMWDTTIDGGTGGVRGMRGARNTVNLKVYYTNIFAWSIDKPYELVVDDLTINTSAADYYSRGGRGLQNGYFRNPNWIIDGKAQIAEYAGGGTQAFELNGPYGFQSETGGAGTPVNVGVLGGSIKITGGGGGHVFRMNEPAVNDSGVIDNVTAEIEADTASPQQPMIIWSGRSTDNAGASYDVKNCTFKTNSQLADPPNTGDVLWKDTKFHIVNDANLNVDLIVGTFAVGGANITSQDSTYENAFSQTEIEDLANTDYVGDFILTTT